MSHVDMKEKWILVTGAGKRVGADIARYFAKQGWNTIIHYRRSKDEALELEAEIKEKYGVQVMLVSGELSNEADVKTIFAQYSPDVVVNNAGKFEEDSFDGNIDANMRALYHMNREAIARILADKKRGTIFVIGDAFIESGGVYSEHLDGYTMSKGWIPGVVSELAAAYGKRGVRVLGVLNGPIDPPPGASETAVASIRAEVNLPEEDLNPWIGGEKVGEAIFHLLHATAINGECIRVDGGRRWTTAREH